MRPFELDHPNRVLANRVTAEPALRGNHERLFTAGSIRDLFSRCSSVLDHRRQARRHHPEPYDYPDSLAGLPPPGNQGLFLLSCQGRHPAEIRGMPPLSLGRTPPGTVLRTGPFGILFKMPITTTTKLSRNDTSRHRDVHQMNDATHDAGPRTCHGQRFISGRLAASHVA